MIDPRLAWFAAGATFGLVLCGWPWHPRFSRFSRRRPYSSAAIAFCATAEDAAKVSSQFINPAVGEPWPEPMTVEEWACRRGPRLDPGRVQRGNGSGGPTTPKPDIVPKPQPPSGRVVDVYGRTIGYIPRSQGDTPNPPPSNP